MSVTKNYVDLENLSTFWNKAKDYIDTSDSELEKKVDVVDSKIDTEIERSTNKDSAIDREIAGVKESIKVVNDNLNLEIQRSEGEDNSIKQRVKALEDANPIYNIVGDEDNVLVDITFTKEGNNITASLDETTLSNKISEIEGYQVNGQKLSSGEVNLTSTDIKLGTDIDKYIDAYKADATIYETLTQLKRTIAATGGGSRIVAVLDELPETTNGFSIGDIILVDLKEYLCAPDAIGSDTTKWYLLGDVTDEGRRLSEIEASYVKSVKVTGTGVDVAPTEDTNGNVTISVDASSITREIETLKNADKVSSITTKDGTYVKLTPDSKTIGDVEISVDDNAIATALAERVSKAGDTMTGALTAPSFIGNLTGNADSATYILTKLMDIDAFYPDKYKAYIKWETGTTAAIKFTDGDYLFRADIATKLQTPRKIWGQSFDGTSDITGFPTFPRFINLNRDSNSGALIDSSALGCEIETYSEYIALKSYSNDGVNRSAHLCLNKGGNVGIGTTTPQAKLHVDGDAIFQNTRVDKCIKVGYQGNPPDITRSQLLLVSEGNVPCDLYLGADNSPYWSITSRNAEDPLNTALAFYNVCQGNYSMGLLPNGNVFIGGVANGYAVEEKLHVYGNVKANNFIGNVTGTASGNLPLSGGTVTGPIEIKSSLTGYYNEGLRITAAPNDWAGITFGSTGLSGAPTNGWYAALTPDDQFIISPNDSTNTTGLTLNAGGDAKWRNNTIIHSGNYTTYCASTGHTHDWSNINNVVVASNEFNFVPSGFNSEIWLNFRGKDFTSATVTGYRFGNGAGGCAPLYASNFITTSDRRLKKNITEIDDDRLKKSLDLNFYEFDYRNTNGHSAGHVAQDVKEVLPEFVRENNSKKDDINYLSLDYTGLHSMQIKALKNKCERLEDENKSLQSRIEKLEKLIEKLL